MIWYVALRSLTATRAAMVQLTVPVVAALGGVLFMSEAISLRLGAATVTILGGVALVLTGREAGSISSTRDRGMAAGADVDSG